MSVASMTVAQGEGGAAAGLFVFIFFAALYLIPSIVAGIRKVPNAGSVFVINLFLGWTLVGWVVALAMAARSTPPSAVQQHIYSSQQAGTGAVQQPSTDGPAEKDGRTFCTECGTKAPPGQKFCGNCGAALSLGGGPVGAEGDIDR